MQAKQKGSGWSIKLVFNLYKLFGYNFVYYLMYPVTFFYALVDKDAKKSLEIYYARLDLPFNNLVYFNHLRTFALTMVDRFISKADVKSYSFVYDNPDRPLEIFSSATILVFSHFGGWAASSNASRSKNTMNVVMQENMKGTIKDIEEALEIKETLKIIDVNRGAIAVSIGIANALMADEVVAIMGDRALNPKATLRLEFLGKDAGFNKNPFEIAYKMKKPLVLYFVALIGKQKYKIEFIEVDIDYAKSKENAIKEAMGVYLKSYEEMLRLYPAQWLNFYNFWREESE